jgi:hypothetical protein
MRAASVREENAVKRTSFIAVAVAVGLIAAYPATAERGSWNNWHLHDGTNPPVTDASGLTHRGVAIFPRIFTNGDSAAYIADPSLWAYCTDATDKALLGPDGAANGSKEASGHCENASYIIHMKTVPIGQSPPEGWRLLSSSTTFYYKLTPRP